MLRLPSNSKKKLYAHQYLLDFVISNSNELEIEVGSDLCQPSLIVEAGFWADIHKIVIYSNKVAVCTVPTVAEALYILLTIHYVLNIKYLPSVFPRLKFLQIKCSRISCKAVRPAVQGLLNKFVN